LAQPNASQPIRQSGRVCQALRHLTDYVCCNVRSKDPPTTNSFHHGPSGTPYPIVSFVTCSNFPSTHQAFLAAITKIVEPRSYYEAAKDPLWQKAMAEEIQALEDKKTWTIVDLPARQKTISCKWAYRVKYRSDGSIERYKARLMIQGDHHAEVLILLKPSLL